jgi:hypothetical protein
MAPVPLMRGVEDPFTKKFDMDIWSVYTERSEFTMEELAR